MKKLKLEELGRKSIAEFKKTDKVPVIIVLDDVRSMFNVGSVFRTADAFLIEKIYLCGITPFPPHRDIHKTALGSTDSVDWEYKKDIYELLVMLKDSGYVIIGAEQTDSSINLSDLSLEKDLKHVIVFGNEVNGLSDNILDLIDHSVEIPQFGTKHSLNVSIAAGIFIYEICYKYIKKMPGLFRA